MAKRRERIALPWETRRSFRHPRDLLRAINWRATIGLMVVIAVVGFFYSQIRQNDRKRETRVAIGIAQRAVERFRTEVGRCPKSIAELLHPPLAGSAYLREVPVDGWGKPLFIRCPSRFDYDRADVVSAGPSGSFQSDDNIQ